MHPTAFGAEIVAILDVPDASAAGDGQAVGRRHQTHTQNVPACYTAESISTIDSYNVKPMIAQTLSSTIYDQSGWHWHNELYAQPTWPAIQTAIRRLDQYRYPFIWLYRTSVIEEDTPYDFNIIGGNGIYAFDGILNNKSFRHIQPDAGKELVDVWTSDQGFETEACYVCRDLDVVLGAAHYFCEYGEPDPTLSWEWDEAPL